MGSRAGPQKKTKGEEESPRRCIRGDRHYSVGEKAKEAGARSITQNRKNADMRARVNTAGGGGRFARAMSNTTN